MYIDIFTYTIFLNISISFLFLPPFPSQPLPSWFPNSFLSLSTPSLAPVLSPFLLAAFPFLPASLNPPLSVPFRPLFNQLFPLFSLFCVLLEDLSFVGRLPWLWPVLGSFPYNSCLFLTFLRNHSLSPFTFFSIPSPISLYSFHSLFLLHLALFIATSPCAFASAISLCISFSLLTSFLFLFPLPANTSPSFLFLCLFTGCITQIKGEYLKREISGSCQLCLASCWPCYVYLLNMSHNSWPLAVHSTHM